MAKEGNTIQSVDRAIEILRCFEKNEELGVTEIGKMVDLHKSTAFNLISTLEKAGLLAKDMDSSKYKLGIELFRLGTLVNSNLREMCRPYLEKLVAEYSETVNLVARSDDMAIYLEKIESPHSMRISTNEGSKLPLYTTAVGKSMMATLPDEEVLKIISQIEFSKFTVNTITGCEELMAQIRSIRDKGYAEDIQEYEMGLTCVAASIRNHTGVAGYAISVSGPHSRMTVEVREKIGQTLVEYAGQLSKKLGYY
jgi:DNA-binding IclR family transcriptional regulator